MKTSSLAMTAFLALQGVSTTALCYVQPCPSSTTASAAHDLETRGFHVTGTSRYEVVESSFGATLNWKFVIAYRYESGDGRIAYATCEGVRDYGFKPGELPLAGGWYRNSCDGLGCRPTERTRVLMASGAVAIQVKDFTLGRFGEDQLSLHMDLKTPPNFRGHPELKGDFVLTQQSGAWVDRSPDGLGGFQESIQLDIDPAGNWTGASILVPPFEFYKLSDVNPTARGEELVIEDLPGRTGITTRPAAVNFRSGEARHLRIVNHSSFNIDVRGASIPPSALVPDGTRGRTDETTVPVAAPSNITLSPYPGSVLVVEITSN